MSLRSRVIIALVLTGALFAQEKDKQDMYSEARNKMVDKQLIRRGITNADVLNVMRKVPRHLFVPESEIENAYNDEPLPIGFEQTISQPYIVAFMTEALNLKATDKVLEIGTGSGYQAAVLSEIVDSVFTVEIIPELSEQAAKLLHKLGYDDVRCMAGDGFAGWPEHAPYDAIIVTAAASRVPQQLIDQLKEEGTMIMPLGTFSQDLVKLSKRHGKLSRKKILPVRFVPMTGEIQK